MVPATELRLPVVAAAGLSLLGGEVPALYAAEAPPIRAAEPPADLELLIKNPQFERLDADVQQQALKVYERLELPSARENFRQMILRTLPDGSSVVSDKDFNGGRLIETLADLQIAPLHPALENHRAEIFKSLTQELAYPGQINQSYYPTCGTGLAYGLFRDNPGEALRLMAGLLQEQGEVTFKSGAVLKRPASALHADRWSGRTVSERVLQSALMEFANGSDENYCNVCAHSYHNESGRLTHEGLPYKGVQDLYTALYGKPYMHYMLGKNSRESLYFCVETAAPGLVQVALQWRTTEEPRKKEWVKRHTLDIQDRDSHLHEEHQYRHNGDGTKIAGGVRTGAHYVHVTEIRDGRVHFRNPHGPTSVKNGTQLTNPPRRVEDNTQGIESMAVADFKARLDAVILPSEMREKITKRWNSVRR